MADADVGMRANTLTDSLSSEQLDAGSGPCAAACGHATSDSEQSKTEPRALATARRAGVVSGRQR